MTETVTFQVDAADLSRKFLLNVNSGPEGTQRLSSGWLSINGVQVIGPDAFNQQISGTSVAITNLVSGQNELQVRLASGPGATIDVSLEGFADPADIPGAVTSEIPNELENTNAPFRPGIIGIKFREGMRVRLQFNSDGTRTLVDLDGLNLTPLENLLSTLGIQAIHRSFNFLPEEMDQDEQAIANMLQVEVPNGNLFYRLEFSPGADIWGIVHQMRSLPFVESAYPDFEIPSANHPQSEPFRPSDPDMYNFRSAWFRNTRIMDQDQTHLGAWHFTKGKPNINLAIIDGPIMHEAFGTVTHEDFLTSSNQPSPNLLIKKNIDINGTPSLGDLSHGTNTVGTVAAVNNNGRGLVGVAPGVTVWAVTGRKTNTATYTKRCEGAKMLASQHSQNTFTQDCNLEADSIIWASLLGAHIIVLEFAGEVTPEQFSPELRVAIMRAIQKGAVVLVPAGNDYNKDISKMNGKPMFDTGSIIIGGVTSDGKARGQIPKLYNYGLSKPSNDPDGFLTDLTPGNGHGTDVSGPAGPEAGDITSGKVYVLSAQFPNGGYDPDGNGTSIATPIVGGIVALMRSVNPNLTPLQTRKILRDTRQQELLNVWDHDLNRANKDIIAGMVDAYQAVKIAGNFGDPPAPPGGGTSGLVAAFYPNTIYNPKELLPVFINKPYAAKIVPNINFPPNDGDAFSVGLTNYYLAEFTGMLNAPTAGTYQFELRHDDGVILKIDGQTVINVNRANSFMNTPSTGNIGLSAGSHTFQLMYYEGTQGAGIQLRWQPPNGSLQDVPASAFSHSTSQKEFSTPSGTKTAPFDKSVYSYEPGYVARFFAKNVTTWPQAIFPANYPFLTRSFSASNTVQGNTPSGSLSFPLSSIYRDGDPFEIGQSDNFSVAFSGFIRPEVTGSYNLTVCHDDGINFYIEETLATPWKSILSPGPTAHRCDAVSNVQLVANQNHRYVLHYDEAAGGAIVELRWQRSGQAQEVVPARVMFH